MTGETYIIIIAVVFLFLIIQGRTLENQRSRKRKERIRARWGEIPDTEYSYEEFESISHYFKKHKRDGYVVDDITWNDLDMDRVFMAINNTWSSIGREYLYRILREPCMDHEELQERNRLSEFFSKNKEIREKVQELFFIAGKTKYLSLSDYIYNLTDVEEQKGKKHYFYCFLFLFSIGGVFLRPQIGIIFFIAVLAFNVVQYYKNKAEIESYFDCIFYLIQLLKCSEGLTELKVPELSGYQKDLKAINKTLHQIKKGAIFIKSGDSMNGSLADAILDYVRMLFHIDLIAFFSIIKKVKNHMTEVDRLLEILGKLESSIAIASFRKAMPFYTIPTLLKQDNLILETKDMYHPLVSDPVANSIYEDGSVLLTGSNASGKSTFLKSVAINAILAQSIYTVLAGSYKANYYKIFSSMALKDALENQESYYIVEIKSLKRILDQTDGLEPVLCFIDEVLRGTNTVERIAASTQILKSLNNKRCLCFAATHDIELTNLLEKEYHNYHFQEEIHDKDILFNYVLYKGRANTRNAIKLLQMLGYPENIIREAEKMAEDFIKTEKWKQQES